MCGIAGILNSNGHAVEASDLQRMGVATAHRGPDNFGCFVSNGAGFAHNRLSIVDLSPAGNQPFCNERYVLLYNGEIYNHLDLRRELRERGVQPRGSSDTAALFECLIHFGVEPTLRKLRGMFAFSFYDTQADELFLCRDRFGIKPLMWTFDGSALYWASEVKAILTVKPCPINVTRTLFAASAGTENSVYLTPFQNVFNVRPGHYLHCKAGREPVSREYFNVAREVDETAYRQMDRMSRQEVLERFDDILRRAVKSLLMSDAPMGCFVSGGIDSSLIARLAVEHNNQLALFTANILGAYSEFADAQTLAAAVNQPLYDVPFEPSMLLDGWAKATWHSEIPIVAHVNSVPFSYVSRLARDRGVKAVLTGEGSDELFLGYPKLLARRWKPWAALPLKMVMGLYGLAPKLKSYVVPEPGHSVETFLWHVVRQFEREHIDADEKSAYSFLPEHSAREHYLTIQMIRSSLHSLLHRNDRMGMLGSIESRFPFLDEEVVRFAVNLPVRFKIGRSWRLGNIKHPFAVDKWIVREIARRRLPERLVRKAKLGFPLYGHRHLRLKKGFFAGGFLDHALGFTDAMEDYLLSACDPYHTGKLASIEVFGRLFGLGDSPEQVTELLHRYANLDTSA